MYLIVYLFLLLPRPAPQTVLLTITSSVAEPGELYLAVYDSEESFQAQAEVTSIVRSTSGKPLSVAVDFPAAGDYVLAAFHDLNGNGKLDVNLFGVPTEPYGFGRVPPSKWRAPTFKEIATKIAPGGNSKEVVLKNWKEY